MSKDFKEKYERVCAIKDRAMSLLEMGMNQDISSIDAKEIGELMDIVKDAEEAIKYAEEACYYHAITEAMKKNSDTENQTYMEKYLPESRRYYTDPYVNRGKNMWPEIYDPNEQDFRKRMYYSDMNDGTGKDMNPNTGSGIGRDVREGRSGITRRTYMEMKDRGEDKTKKSEELKKYGHDLVDDLSEMLQDASVEDKTALKQLLANFVNKM